jgi:exonuclease VII large subunit
MPIEEPHMSTPGDMPHSTPSTPTPAAGVMDKARDAAMSRLETGKSRAAESVSGVAESLRQAGRSMDQNTDLPVGEYMHQAAEQLERLSHTLISKEPEELLMEAERYARRQPAVFLGLAFATGLVAARFLKSSRGGVTLRDRAVGAYQSATTEGVSAGTSAYESQPRYSEPVGQRPAGGW